MNVSALVLVLSLHGGAVPAGGGDSWFAADKVKHFLSSAFVQSVAFSALRLTNLDRQSSIVGASVATATVGVAKEIHDGRVKHEFSVRDLVWDGLGGAAATVLLAQTR